MIEGPEHEAAVQGRSILIVEDNEGIRFVMQTALELKGYTVFTAENGQVGLDIISKIGPPCLILLDLMMPVMNGWDFAVALERDDLLATVPLVIISAYSEKMATIKSKEMVAKPINLKTLYEIVERWCPLENGVNGPDV